MSTLLTDWFRRAFEAPEDQGMASFEEVFGRPPEEAFLRPNPFDGPDDDEDDETPATPAAGDPPADPDDAEEDDDDEDDDAPAAWQQEMEKRFAPGTFTEEGWKAYRNMEVAFSQRQSQQPAPEPPRQEEPPPPPPRPLGGKVGEINSEEELYNEAQLRPRETAMWALDNHQRLTPEQYNNVMNLWFVSNPTEYTEFRERALMEAMEERFQERFQHETAAQVDNARAQGLADAYGEMPLIQEYRPQLSKFMNDNQHLNEWVNGLRTAHEVKSAVQSIFYMMAGPELARQAVAQQAQQALDAAQAAAETPPATPPPDPATAATTRRSSQPHVTPGTKLSDEDYAKGIQNKILNMGVR